jgi:phosphoribosyl 1,2-cyclic phosphodiesterase
MSLFVTAIASGSNGNCYYIGNQNEAVLIDVGISCREIEQRLKSLELSVKKIKAIFISHEHTDHIRGTRQFSHKYNIPVYITPKTLQHSKLDFLDPLHVKLNTLEVVQVGELQVLAFPKWHDASDPQSFVVSGSGVTIGVMTDIGAACQHVQHYLGLCHAVFLESNYDEQMLLTGRYPAFLKQRVHSDVGHLSNKQAVELVSQFAGKHLSHIFLSHISKDNNSPEIASQIFKSQTRNIEIVLTSRQEATAVYEIGVERKSSGLKEQRRQISLF